jgi:hypothetical protein
MRIYLAKRRIGVLLSALHFAFLLGVLAGKSAEFYGMRSSEVDSLTFSSWGAAGTDMIAARAFHFAYEHFLVQLLMLIDVPALLIGGLLVLVPLEPFIHPVVNSYLAAALWLGLGSLQWFLLGARVDAWRRKGSLTAPVSGGVL